MILATILVSLNNNIICFLVPFMAVFLLVQIQTGNIFGMRHLLSASKKKLLSLEPKIWMIAENSPQEFLYVQFYAMRSEN